MAETVDSTSSLRTCRRCGEAKALTAFPKAKNCAGGRAATCSACRASLRTPESRARSDESAKAWRKANPERWLAIRFKQEERKRRRAGMRDAATLIADQEAHRQRKAIVKATAEADRAAIKRAAMAQRLIARPWSDPALSRAASFALRYKLDPSFNIRQRLRAAERRRQRGLQIGEHIRSAIHRNGSSPRVESLLGYTIDDLRRHLERQFVVGMTWTAYLEGRIHIDHRRPLASFDLSDEDQWRDAWSLTNLQPLWAEDNLAKRASRSLLL